MLLIEDNFGELFAVSVSRVLLWPDAAQSRVTVASFQQS